MGNMLWTNSGDSHFIEPPDLFKQNLPAALADRLPRSQKVSDTEEIELIRTSRRFVPTATLPLQSVELSIKEAQRCADLGFLAVFVPTEPAKTDPYWNDDHWEPLWSVCEEAGLVIGVHIGTDADGNRP